MMKLFRTKSDSQQRSLSEKVLHGLDDVGGALCSRRPSWQVYLIAFGLPFVALLLVWLGACVIFGNQMILAHDQWHQYYPFFLDLQRKLQNGNSLFYSWTNAMGTNYLSMAAYYLASPMNLLVGLLPERMALVYYTFTVMVKISLGSLFCTVFLRKLFDRSDLTVVFFSVMYSFCAFICGYYWNAIWLDTVALLPLVALGAISLLRDGKFILYTSMLALSIFCSYYIGLFTCIFVLLLFICYNICYWDDWGGFGARLARIAFFSLLGIGMTALLSVPAFLGLQATSSAENSFPEEFALNIVSEKSWLGILDGLRQIISQLGTGIVPTTMEGLPNIACGTVTVTLAIAYFSIGKVKLREKLCTAGLLLFFCISFLVRQLDYIWHGFHFPNMLPYRFSFLFSFVLLFMAYRAFTNLSRWRWYHCLYIAPFAVLFLFCVFSQQRILVGVITAVLMLLTIGGLWAYSKKYLTKRLLSLLLCVLLLGEACIGLYYGSREVGFTSAASYPSAAEDTAQIIDTMNSREEGTVDLWRAETTLTQTLNDNALNGYNGISTFSSAANCGVSQFLKGIGLPASVAGNRYAYEETNPLTNTLLGLKYLIDRDGLDVERPYFDVVSTSGDVTLLENNTYIPFGFMLKQTALEYDADARAKTGRISNINYLYQLLSGSHGDLITQCALSEFTSDDGIEVSGSNSQFTFTEQEDTSGGMTAYFTYRIDKDCHFCVYASASNTESVKVDLNGERLTSYNAKYGYMRDFGILHAGDELTFSTALKKGKTGGITIYAGTFNDAAFDDLYESLSSQHLIATKVTDTEIEGTIIAKEDGVCYLSIPYDEGWSATVDGKKATVVSVFGAFIGIRLAQGAHTVSLSYETPGFQVGLTVSFICLAVFFLLIVISLLRKVLTPPLQQVDMDMLGQPAERGANPTQSEPQEAAYYEPIAEAPPLPEETDGLPDTEEYPEEAPPLPEDAESLPDAEAVIREAPAESVSDDETQVIPVAEIHEESTDRQWEDVLDSVNDLLREDSEEQGE